MVKYGEFTVILNNNRSGIFNNLYYNIFGSSNDDESNYKHNSDIIYTFYDNNEQSYSQREICSAINDYENKYFYFCDDYFERVIHPKKINMTKCTIKLIIPKYELETNSYRVNFSKIFNEIQIDKKSHEIISSRYNCIYVDNLTNKNIFSVVKYKSSDTFPSFIFYYDDTILDKKDVIYLIKKIIDVDFK